MIDTHCHLNFRAFKDDAAEVIAQAKLAGVNSIINIGSQYETSERAVKMAQGDDNLYAAIGLHPIHLFKQEVDEEEIHFKTKAEIFNPAKYKKLFKENERVVAIGECGLDFYRFPAEIDKEEIKARQKELFEQQIKLASELNLPIIIHCRDGYNDIFQVLEKAIGEGLLPKRGVSHCFLGTGEQAKKFLDLGFLLSFTGIITFKNVSPGLLKIVKETPLDKMMVETDAPYLTPQAYRGTRNEPAYVVEVAKKIAEIKGVSLEEVDRATTFNAQQLFGI